MDEHCNYKPVDPDFSKELKSEARIEAIKAWLCFLLALLIWIARIAVIVFVVLYFL